MNSELSACYGRERERLNRLLSSGFTGGELALPVFGEGEEGSLLMLIGEAPGREESECGRPFVGKAGRELNALLQDAGILRERVYVTNAVKYRPTKQGARGKVNRTPKKDEILAALPLLREEIRLVRPRVIATLGNTPLFSVLTSAKMPASTVGEVHGTPVSIAVGEENVILFPLYHPASVIYNRSLQPVLAQDLRALGELLKPLS